MAIALGYLPLETEAVMSPAERDAFRQAQLDAIPRSYSPLLHAVAPSAWCLVVLSACIWLVQDIEIWEWLTLPITWVLANMAEWRIHRDLLHKRSRLAPGLYERHTPIHHMIYVDGDLQIRDWRELKLVLIPAWAGVALFVGVLPLAAALYFFVSPNVAYLFEAACAFYVMTYELLHMSYHLPADTSIGKNPLIRALARHHSLHHDPRNMQKWNMNVTLPLWDLVRRTRLVL
jgi:hypothetical protein